MATHPPSYYTTSPDDDYDFPCSAAVRGIPYEAWDQKRQELEAKLDQAMKDIEENMNETGWRKRGLDTRAKPRFYRGEAPQGAKTPTAYQEPLQRSKGFIPRRDEAQKGEA